MNIHPIIVHFPIALLAVWSIIEILPLKKWLPTVQWTSVSRVLLFIGYAGAYLALQTGETAREIIGASPLVRVHSNFATITTYLFLIFVIRELILILQSYVFAKSMHIDNPSAPAPTKKNLFEMLPWFDTLCIYYLKITNERFFSVVFALIALSCLLMTGLLGGAIVFGTSADPLAKIVLPWFGL